jgi:hypothetical protein
MGSDLRESARACSRLRRTLSLLSVYAESGDDDGFTTHIRVGYIFVSSLSIVLAGTGFET